MVAGLVTRLVRRLEFLIGSGVCANLLVTRTIEHECLEVAGGGRCLVPVERTGGGRAGAGHRMVHTVITGKVHISCWIYWVVFVTVMEEIGHAPLKRTL